MIILSQSIKSFGTNQFHSDLKKELAAINKAELPLYQATTQGGLVDNQQVSISVLSSKEKIQIIEAKLSVFFDETVGGCSCGDPPMKVNNYCEILLEINKQTAIANFVLLSD